MNIKSAKYYAFLLLLVLSQSLKAQGHWEPEETPAEGFLKAVHFADSLHGWIAGNNGLIIHTQDGGNSWSQQESGTDNDISDIFFLDNNLGWATSFNFSTPPYGTLLLKTIDGGQTWAQIPYPEENIFMNCVLFLDEMNGWMGGSPHALVRSTDGGSTWQQVVIDTSTLAFFPVISIEFYDENYGYACGGLHDIAGVVWMTSNGGDTWHAIDVLQAPADEIHELHAFDSIRVMGIGGDPDFAFGAATIQTEDGGENWIYEEIGAQGNGFDLDFRTDYEAWAPLGGTGNFVYSLDTGNTWTEIPVPGGNAIFDVHFPDSLHGWAVGQDGAVLRYIPPFPVSIEEIALSNQDNLNLYNYPDPFAESTMLHFSIPGQGWVELKVYNMDGRLLEVVFSGTLSDGQHSFHYDHHSGQQGIFFLKLQFISDDKHIMAVEKMVGVGSSY